ncbi:MAG TPA: leucine-rich repeat domain-containing protein [Bacteroidia bacterium]|nr:leucine-rich repeat domain-containing protein [Bacteroidia bacterium]
MEKEFAKLICKIQEITGLGASDSITELANDRFLSFFRNRRVLKAVSFAKRYSKKKFSFWNSFNYEMEYFYFYDIDLIVPKEIFEFTSLQHLYFENCTIKTIPDEISHLNILEELTIKNCSIDSIPDSVLTLTSLKKLNLEDNKIDHIPDSIIGLKNVKEINLSKNILTEIPSSILELPNLDIIDISENPLVFPYDQLINKSLLQWYHFFNAKNGKINLGKIPQSIKTAIKQYLLYFSDYVKNFKGLDIKIEITDTTDGLEVNFNDSIDESIVSDLLNEYLNFVGSNVEKVKPDFDIEKDEIAKDVAIVDLRNQLRFLQSSLETKAVEVRALRQERDNYFTLLSTERQNPRPIMINASSVSSPVITNTTSININIHQEIPHLQSEFHELNKALKDIPQEDKEELKALDDELLNINLEKDPKTELRKPANRLKRILDAINDEGSSLNKAVKAGDKTIKAAQKLAKTYNKIAQWLALPQVPDVFLKD